MQTIYAWQQAGLTAEKGKELLDSSIFSTHEVYLSLLELPAHFRDYLKEETQREKAKYYPDKERIRRLSFLESGSLAQYLYDHTSVYKSRYYACNWPAHEDFFKTLFAEVENTDFFTDYVIFDSHDLSHEVTFFEQFYAFLFEKCGPFQQIMEDMYTAWDDDIEAIYREVAKTLKSAVSGQKLHLAKRLLKGDEDVVFGHQIYEAITSEGDELVDDIQAVTDNWDPGRIAVLDLIAIKMAIVEFKQFPLIPVKVTINEYLEIIKDFSTPGSSRFLNGVLDKIRIKLEAEGKIQKSGRGLRDN